MAARPRFVVTIVLLLCVLSICLLRSESVPGVVCPRTDFDFLEEFGRDGSRCPVFVERSPPLEVTGDFLDMVLSSGQKNAVYSILFHGSWCPFSRHARHLFDALGSMYPQIVHLTVEESSALPSVFSRYGVHSFPSIIVVNQTMRVQYHGPKDLSSLLFFYEIVTGLEPITLISVDQPVIPESDVNARLWNGSPRDVVTREPYLAFAILFICIRGFMYFFPGFLLYQLKLLWASYICHLNFGIFGGSSQIVERTLHLIDMKRLWSNLWLSNKTRNFHKGANNARVWASSLTSVSLGEPSSSRTTPSDK